MRVFVAVLIVWLGGSQQSAYAGSAQVRVQMEGRAGHYLSAQRLNGKKVANAGYFLLQPGSGRLDVRLSYDKGSRLGGRRHCLASLNYADFSAGENYSVRAIAHGYTVRIWLQDAEGRRLVESSNLRCGPQY